MKLARRSKVALQVCGALFCCASFALGQSVGAASSAEVNASAPSAEVNATPGMAASATVSSIALQAYGAGAGSGHSQGSEAIMRYQSSGMSSQHPENGSWKLGAAKTDSANARSMLETRTRRAAVAGSKLSLKEAAVLRKYKTGQVPGGMLSSTAAERIAAGAGKASALKGASGLVSTYTTDFPDSTKGTALVSPPDLGTASPLEWSPDIGFSLPDFTNKEFLTPSLHVVRRHSGSRRENLFGRRQPAQSLAKNKPKKVDLLQMGLPSLETSVPSIDSPDSSLLSPLDQP